MRGTFHLNACHQINQRKCQSRHLFSGRGLIRTSNSVSAPGYPPTVISMHGDYAVQADTIASKP